MSPSCSSILPRALSLWQHGLGRPHPPLLSPPPPPHCWIVCLSSYPPSTPTPCCMQQIGTPAAPNAAQLFHQAVTQAQPLWLTVFITAAGVTLESIWHSVCACTCVCACACVCVRMCVCVLPLFSVESLLGWSLRVPLNPPCFFSACQEHMGAQFTELVVQNKSSCLPLHLRQIEATSGVTGHTLAELNWTHSVFLGGLWRERGRYSHVRREEHTSGRCVFLCGTVWLFQQSHSALLDRN